jgi:hypothetical protein
MTADVSIYNAIKTTYGSTTYFNKFPDIVTLNSATPQILIKNISQTKRSTKDISGRFEATYRVEVIGTVYLTVKDTAAAITVLLENFTDSAVHLCSYDGEYYDTNETAEIHRVITDYRTFINL